MAKPFESRIQDLVYNVDVGIGLRLIKLGLYILFVVIVLLVYTATQFTWFDNSEAMDYAQLGRNLSERGEYVTQVVRPASIRFLIEHKETVQVNDEGEEVTKGGDPRMENHPEILHPPLYPAAISTWFKIMGVKFDYKVEGGKYGPELMVVALCHIFTVITGIFVWLLGRRLFDNRVGLLGMSIFFLSDAVWSTSISGLDLPLTTCLATIALYASLVAVENREKGLPGIRWIIPFILSALFCSLTLYTRYGAWIVVPAVALYYAIGFPRRGWIYSLILVFIVCAGYVPWIARNLEVSGAPFGMAPSMVIAETGMFPENTYERALAPDEDSIKFKTTYKGVRAKFFKNLDRYYRVNLRSVGDGILICLFISSFLYRFVRRNVHQFRWCILLALFLNFLCAGFYGDKNIALTYMFWPVVIAYGLAFFYLLLDRLQLRMPIQRLAIITVVVLISAGPMVITLMPPKKNFPYPPYNRPIITHVTTLLSENETICSDIPWATAWYGGRNSLLLPQTIDEFYEINDFIKRISGLYFTTVTRNQPFVRTLLTGRERSWFPIHQGRMPGDFPLTQGFPLQNLDQLFITDRNRLEEATQAR